MQLPYCAANRCGDPISFVFRIKANKTAVLGDHMHEYTCRLTFEQDEEETEAAPPTLTAHCSTYIHVERNHSTVSLPDVASNAKKNNNNNI